MGIRDDSLVFLDGVVSAYPSLEIRYHVYRNDDFIQGIRVSSKHKHPPELEYLDVLNRVSFHKWRFGILIPFKYELEGIRFS